MNIWSINNIQYLGENTKWKEKENQQCGQIQNYSTIMSI